MDSLKLANLLIFVIILAIFVTDIYIKANKIVAPFNSDIYFYSDIILLLLLTYLVFKTKSINKKGLYLLFMVFLIMVWVNSQIINKNKNNDKISYFFDGALASFSLSNILI